MSYGNWEIIKSLSEGGQAHTFLVKNLKDPNGKPYVLKRLKNINRLERFKREIEVGLRLDHPNIVKVHDFYLGGSKPYLVCEYCNGGDLKMKGVGTGLGLLKGLKLFRPICSGVAFAHKNGIIHRDLKPNNIFFKTDERTPLVGDFGICFIDEHGDRFTMLKEAVGPRIYIAPELEDGRVESITPRSDVYSLGKILYWLITGEEFSREKHRDPKYDLVKRFKSAKLEHVNRLLDKMIVSNPDKRLSSVSYT